MGETYWVGMLKDVGLVLYDPDIQKGNSDKVELYVIHQDVVASYQRKTAHENVKTVKVQASVAVANARYRIWKARQPVIRVPDQAAGNPASADKSTMAIFSAVKHPEDSIAESTDSPVAQLKPKIVGPTWNHLPTGVQVGELPERGLIVYDPACQRQGIRNICLYIVNEHRMDNTVPDKALLIITDVNDNAKIWNAIQQYKQYTEELSAQKKKKEEDDDLPWDILSMSSYDYDRLPD